jgi:hypothetical protein
MTIGAENSWVSTLFAPPILRVTHQEYARLLHESVLRAQLPPVYVLTVVSRPRTPLTTRLKACRQAWVREGGWRPYERWRRFCWTDEDEIEIICAEDEHNDSPAAGIRSHGERVSRPSDCPGRDCRGHCYEVTMFCLTHHLLDEPVLQLVHGTIYLQGQPLAHAWIEMDGGTVFDPLEQRFFARQGYYQVRQAEPAQVYSRMQAGPHALRTGHCGPWDETTL